MGQIDDLRSISIIIETDPGGTGEKYYMMKAPRPLTVEATYMVSEAAQAAGTALTGQLENWGTAGTAVEATVTDTLGGTAAASRLSARTPADGSVNRANNFFDQGDWMVFGLGEEGSGFLSGDRITYEVHYKIGRGNTTATP